MHWRCAKGHWVEETSRESYPLGEPVTSDSHWIDNRFDALCSSRASLSDPTYFRNLLRSYTTRRLRYESDTLNAISGISSMLQQITGHYYHWGLPDYQFSQALAWEFRYAIGFEGGPEFTLSYDYHRNSSLHSLRLSTGKVVQIPFPTWSWSGWKMGQYVAWNPYRPNRFDTTPSLVEVSPEIAFYYYDETGAFRRLPDGDYTSGKPFSTDRISIEDKFTNSRNQWMGFPNRIEGQAPLTVEELEAGIQVLNQLMFWTSCATVRCRIPMAGRAFSWSSPRTVYTPTQMARSCMLNFTKHITTLRTKPL